MAPFSDQRVFPIAVVKIASDHDEINAQIKSLEQQLFHGFATSEMSYEQ